MTDSRIVIMASKILFSLVLISFILIGTYGLERGTFMGCFKEIKTRIITLQLPNNIESCTIGCAEKYYRYTYKHLDRPCDCGNFLGEEQANVTCNVFCPSCNKLPFLIDIYATGNTVSGPPRNVQISNITARSLNIMWSEPESFVVINEYQIKVMMLHTYSSYPPKNIEYRFSNNTFQTKLIALIPGTTYNISVCTYSSDGYGAPETRTIQTTIGEPDNPPPKPQVIRRDGNRMTIRLFNGTNNNGPISSYIVVVFNEDSKQGFQISNLASFQEAKKNMISYYIAAELKPNELGKEFIIGDGKTYGEYLNAPLDPEVNYKVIVGLVSTLRGVRKVAFSDANGDQDGVLILNVQNADDSDGDGSGVIVALSIGIVLLSLLLIAGIVGFFFLRKRITNRRQRLSDNQELTLQGPMIEVENNGYIPEEEHLPIDHYHSLKQKVYSIPSEQLQIGTDILGTGKFGRVTTGTFRRDSEIQVAVYNIPDKKMGHDTKRSMLMDLDLLIRSGHHQNVIDFIGTHEAPKMVYVVLEYVTMNLKDYVLGSRELLGDRFSSLSEDQILNILVQVAQGMAHLESCKVIHTQLCARSVMISNGIPKISNYGLAQFYKNNKIPDCTRWTACEVLRNKNHTSSKSDVWSFGCLLWEVCALGGTPYGTLSNQEVIDGLFRSLRLPQLPYFGDDLYQVMYDCWQREKEDRPSFVNIAQTLEHIRTTANPVLPLLNFKLYPKFEYEEFYPDTELTVKCF